MATGIRTPEGLNFIGQFFGCVGIANHARSFAEALSNNVGELALAPIFDNTTNDQYGLTDKIKASLAKPKNEKYPSLMYWYPNTFPKIIESVKNSPKKIGYYIFEYTKIPVDYIPILNSLDAVCTPSPWGVEVLKANGVTVPVYSIPGGVDHSLFNLKNKKLDDKKFRFIHVGKKENRKNTDKIIRAFARAFDGDRKVKMTLFINNGHIPGFDPKTYVHEVLSAVGLEGCYSAFDVRDFENDMTAVYNAHHAGVWASSSEGIGLPTLEAMACGLPVITTKNSAMLDYVNDKNSIILPNLIEEPVYDPNFFPQRGAFGTWNSPLENDIIESLKWVKDNYDKASEIGKYAEQWVSENYNWDLSAKKFIEIL